MAMMLIYWATRWRARMSRGGRKSHRSTGWSLYEPSSFRRRFWRCFHL